MTILLMVTLKKLNKTEVHKIKKFEILMLGFFTFSENRFICFQSHKIR